jgi:hypothetical protein
MVVGKGGEGHRGAYRFVLLFEGVIFRTLSLGVGLLSPCGDKRGLREEEHDEGRDGCWTVWDKGEHFAEEAV